MNKVLIDNNLNGYSVLDIFTKKNVNNFEKKILEKINIKINNSTHLRKELKNLKYFHKIPFSKKEKSKIFEPKDRFIKLNTQILKKIKKNKFINKILYEQWDIINIKLCGSHH